MAALGINIRLSIDRPGFFPRGGGLVRAKIASCPAVRSLRLDAVAPVRSATGFSAVAGLPEHILQRQAETIEQRMRELGFHGEVRREKWVGGPGAMSAIELPTSPAPTFFFGLGERGKPAERVANEAIDQTADFLATEPLGIDEHSADQ